MVLATIAVEYGDADASHTWDVSDEQLKEAWDAMSKPGHNGRTDNCIDRICDALDAAGIDHPPFNTNEYGVSDPNELIDWLEDPDKRSKTEEKCLD